MYRGGCDMTEMKGRKIFKGKTEGEALVTKDDISFFGGCDPETGEIVEKDHELEGQSVSGKVLVFPSGKGSTVGSYVLYALKKAGKAPLAIINKSTDPVVAVGCIISEIPAVDQIDTTTIKTGQKVEVDADNGVVLVKD
jgi:predicted aconitase with swiveling domain